MKNSKDLAMTLNVAKVFYLATADADGTPHVRPFGAVVRYEGHTWFCTGKGKAVHEQLQKNDKVEIAAFMPGMDAPCWVRAKGHVVLEDNEGAKQAMFAAFPQVKEMYADKKDQFVVFYFVGEANLHDLGGNVIESLTV